MKYSENEILQIFRLLNNSDIHHCSSFSLDYAIIEVEALLPRFVLLLLLMHNQIHLRLSAVSFTNIAEFVLYCIVAFVCLGRLQYRKLKATFVFWKPIM